MSFNAGATGKICIRCRSTHRNFATTTVTMRSGRPVEVCEQCARELKQIGLLEKPSGNEEK